MSATAPSTTTPSTTRPSTTTPGSTPGRRAELRARALLVALASLLARTAGRARPRDGAERGDVPGWVLITVMTAALVTILWTAAATVLPDLFSQAISSVHGSGG